MAQVWQKTIGGVNYAIREHKGEAKNYALLVDGQLDGYALSLDLALWEVSVRVRQRIEEGEDLSASLKEIRAAS